METVKGRSLNVDRLSTKVIQLLNPFVSFYYETFKIRVSILFSTSFSLQQKLIQ